MTREEAITKLKSFCHNCEKFPTCVNTDKECFKALETAIEALEQEPCDCITLRLKKGALKYSDKDYVVYKKEWLKKWWQPEMMMLGVTLNIAYDNDAISRKAAEMCLTANITDMTIEEYISMVGDRLKGLPSVQPKEAYNKGWKDGAEATAYHVELCEEENPTIPMAVIEDIKAEIEKTVCEELNYCDVDLSFLKWCAGLKYSLRIIDKHIEDIGGK